MFHTELRKLVNITIVDLGTSFRRHVSLPITLNAYAQRDVILRVIGHIFMSGLSTQQSL